MKQASAWALGLLFAVTSAQAQTQSPDPLQARSWAAGCASCHGTNGRAEPGMIALAGANKDELVKKMQDYKTGRVSATLMHQIAKGYSDAQIVAIASYFAEQKK
jgi:cytochrome c553